MTRNNCGRSHSQAANNAARHYQPESNVDMRRPRRRFQRRLPFLIVDVLLRVIILALLASATGIVFNLPSSANAQYVVPRILAPISMVLTVVGLGYTCSFFPSSRSTKKSGMDCVSIALEVCIAICIGMAAGFAKPLYPAEPARQPAVPDSLLSKEHDASAVLLPVFIVALVFQTVIFAWSCISCCDSGCQGGRSPRQHRLEEQNEDASVGEPTYVQMVSAPADLTPAASVREDVKAIDTHQQPAAANTLELPSDPPPAYSNLSVSPSVAELSPK